VNNFGSSGNKNLENKFGVEPQPCLPNLFHFWVILSVLQMTTPNFNHVTKTNLNKFLPKIWLHLILTMLLKPTSTNSFLKCTISIYKSLGSILDIVYWYGVQKIFYKRINNTLSTPTRSNKKFNSSKLLFLKRLGVTLL